MYNSVSINGKECPEIDRRLLRWSVQPFTSPNGGDDWFTIKCEYLSWTHYLQTWWSRDIFGMSAYHCIGGIAKQMDRQAWGIVLGLL